MQSLIIVDDSKIFRKVIEHIVGPHFKIVGSVGSADQGLELVQEQKPDLVLLDITMPNMSGKEALGKILEMNSNAKVIMVSSVGDDSTVVECLRIGAKAFISKDRIKSSDGIDSPLMKAIQAILSGACYREVA